MCHKVLPTLNHYTNTRENDIFLLPYEVKNCPFFKKSTRYYNNSIHYFPR